jgi:Ca-activated chloride channel family protein
MSLLASNRFFKKLLNSNLKAKNIIRFILMFFGMLFLFLAMLKPRWGKTEEVFKQEGRDVIIALDISRSMLAKDIKPNRLTFAKEKIKNILELLLCERAGLLLFAGDAIMQCPLTSDFKAFVMFLDQVDVETISNGTTSIENALYKALEVFGKSERKNKLLVLITDGEDFSSNLKKVKEEASAKGLNVFVIGVGTPEGAPIPVLGVNGKQVGNQLNSYGEVVMSRLNEGILLNLANDTGGKYLSLTLDDSDLHLLLNYLRKFEKEKIAKDKALEVMEERYPYFLIMSFICFVLEWVL